VSPRVSIVVPTHNRAGYLREALESLREQTFEAWECVVVDDGSTDDTPAVLSALAASDGRIHPLRLEHGGTAGRSRNAGVRESRGALLAFLDDDDLWLPDKLAKQLALLDREPEVQMAFGKVRQFGDEHGIWPGVAVPPRPPLELLLRENVVPCSTVVIRRGAFEAAGGFSERRRIAEDYELWLRVRRAAPIGAMPDVLCRYRVHRGGLTRRLTSELDEQADLYATLEREWGLSPGLLRPARRRIARKRARLARSLRDRLAFWWEAFTA
jgi:teichuronic acid biosynthesis glycosyltransferase TuaG